MCLLHALHGTSTTFIFHHVGQDGSNVSLESAAAGKTSDTFGETEEIELAPKSVNEANAQSRQAEAGHYTTFEARTTACENTIEWLAKTASSESLKASTCTSSGQTIQGHCRKLPTGSEEDEAKDCSLDIAHENSLYPADMFHDRDLDSSWPVKQEESLLTLTASSDGDTSEFPSLITVVEFGDDIQEFHSRPQFQPPTQLKSLESLIQGSEEPSGSQADLNLSQLETTIEAKNELNTATEALSNAGNSHMRFKDGFQNSDIKLSLAHADRCNSIVGVRKNGNESYSDGQNCYDCECLSGK